MMDMSVSRKTATIILNSILLCGCFLFCFMALVSCGTSEKNDSTDTSIDSESIPDEVQAFMDAYLKACEEGPEASVEFVYYPEEYADLYTYHRDSGYNLLSYEIKDRQRISESLYAFHMYYVTEWRDTEAYTFVARIDNEYRIILNTEYIPLDLKQGIDEKDFYIEPPPGIETVDPSDLL